VTSFAALFLPLALLGTTPNDPQASGFIRDYAPCNRDGAGNVVPGHREIYWPDVHPVWSMCAVRPSQSTGNDGSGLELYNVRYKGHVVFKRAHAPVLNVLYTSGCGCFRDWSDSEHSFYINTPATAPGWAETQKVQTACENRGMDIGSFNGVAAQNNDDGALELTAQMQAGWYRYVMRWFFYPDGKLVAWFGFGAVSNNCVNFDHTHHNYWRFDFDVDGPDNDYIDVVQTPGANPSPVSTEMTTLRGPDHWVVRDGTTGRGYKITPGASIAPGTFGVSDVWLLRYKANEMDDPSGGCQTQINGYLSGESLSGQDVVFWVRGGEFHEGGDFDACHSVNVTMEPVGNW
jgi:hypothetical protein